MTTSAGQGSSASPVGIEPVAGPPPVPRDTAGLREGEDLFRIALRMTPGWMAVGESVELRFPEVLRSSAGFHLLDHYLSALAPLSDPAPLPVWRRDQQTGAWAYLCTLSSGVTVSARALPRLDAVDLTFAVTNDTDEWLEGVEPTMCLNLKGAPLLGRRSDVRNLFASWDGALMPLSAATPSADDLQRDPWLLILSAAGAGTFPGPRVSSTWWCVDQVTDRALMAARSFDGRHLIGLAWEGNPPSLMSNGNNPCLHAGPAPASTLAPGGTVTFRGKVYFPEGALLSELAARYDADRQAWQRAVEPSAPPRVAPQTRLEPRAGR